RRRPARAQERAGRARSVGSAAELAARLRRGAGAQSDDRRRPGHLPAGDALLAGRALAARPQLRLPVRQPELRAGPALPLARARRAALGDPAGRRRPDLPRRLCDRAHDREYERARAAAGRHRASYRGYRAMKVGIVGGGALGLALAYYLGRDGVEVT